MPTSIETQLAIARAEIDVDGVVDSKGIRYIGKATRQPNGLWLCLADVGGALCRVEVRITISDFDALANRLDARKPEGE